MSLRKKLFGTPAPLEDSDLDAYVAVSTSAETRRIEALVTKAQEYYPHKDPAKALALFRQAIELASPAPASKSVRESRDLTSIGDAFWMAWVCLDLLDRPQSETDALLAEARIKSPATAVRIEERLAEAKKDSARERQLEEAFAALESVDDQDSATVQEALTTLSAAGAWWALRDAGIALTKQGKYDLAWGTPSKALTIAMGKSGNIPSIYSAMGDLRKAQQRHAEAARHYLLSCLSAGHSPLKRAVDQLRISLKKAGVPGDPAAIRDELLAMGARGDDRAVLTRLDCYLASTADDPKYKDPGRR